jgi:hypothetical protein
MSQALGLKRQIPATLPFIQTTQKHVHLTMLFSVTVRFTSPARTALAGVDRLSWHTCVSSPPFLAALYVIPDLAGRGRQKPEVIV